MKRLGFTFLALIFSSTVALSGAWAGVDYIKYHEQFQASKADTSEASPQKGRSFQHKSKYFRDQDQGQDKTVAPTSDKKPGTGQKYERPDWAK